MNKYLLLSILFSFMAIPGASAQISTPDTSNVIAKIFTFVDKQPVFPGGTEAFNKFLLANLKAPKEVRKKKLSGKVVAQFVINYSGKVEDIQIVKSLSPACDEAVIQTIQKFPTFEPAQLNGTPVKFRYTLPVNFHP